MRSSILLAALLAASPAAAATLKPLTTLNGSVVRLSDLFADAGRNADLVLGPGPAPGARIVVESRQLAAIARSYGVEWRPAYAAERAVLDRPGRALPREAVIAALTAALVSAGAPADAEIEVAAYDPPMVPADPAIKPVVTQLAYDAASGRFTAELGLDGDKTDAIAWRVAGETQSMVPVVVAATRLLPGSILRAEDLRLAKLPAERVAEGTARRIGDAVGKQLRIQAAPGVPLPLSDLSAPILVSRGRRILIVADAPGLSLTEAGQALESGSAGEHVRVLNPNSKAVVDAVVIGDGKVRVDPSAPPLTPAGGARR